jgi:hypothetical protein
LGDIGGARWIVSVSGPSFSWLTSIWAWLGSDELTSTISDPDGNWSAI